MERHPPYGEVRRVDNAKLVHRLGVVVVAWVSLRSTAGYGVIRRWMNKASSTLRAKERDQLRSMLAGVRRISTLPWRTDTRAWPWLRTIS